MDHTRVSPSSQGVDEKQLDRKHLDPDSHATELEVADEARLATAKEHGLTLRQGLKAYRKAIGWSILLSSAVIMEGYDTILVSRSFGAVFLSRLSR